jgi:hypothetical protein
MSYALSDQSVHPKPHAQIYLQAKSDSHPEFTWTAIANGLFLDWGLQSGVIVDLAQHSATLSDGDDVPLSATNHADVAEAVLRGLYSIASRLGNRLRSYIGIQTEMERPHDDHSSRIYTSHFTCIHTYSQH